MQGFLWLVEKKVEPLEVENFKTVAGRGSMGQTG